MSGLGALELFNEAKDSVAVTLRDLTHDAKRLAPFDVTQPPRAGVGGKDGGGVCLWSVRQGWRSGALVRGVQVLCCQESHPEPRAGV